MDLCIFRPQGEPDREYPAHIDMDLKENYDLEEITVDLPEEGYSQYRIFTSRDGRDFELLAVKDSRESCDPEIGDVFDAGGREARIIRLYIEYNAASTKALWKEVKVTGVKNGKPVQARPKLQIEAWEESVYAEQVTDGNTLEEVYGIIDRRLGSRYRSWFAFTLCENPKQNGYDYYQLSEKDGKVQIRGNSGVSLAAGLNHYLKYDCQVHISQVGDQVQMPEKRPPMGETVFRETKARVRYAYNYCTFSYSMAFWGEKEWRRELDWLALNGVNVVLDLTAQEEVWRRFLTKFGYTHEEILRFITGPAYYAWAYMGNLSGFGGPVHDSWFEERTKLARTNHRIMRRLGMQPVKQGYSGMVPADILTHDKTAEVIPQGTWNSFERPLMLRTTAPGFKKYARMFYEAQDQVYGRESHYYATDPFHEGGRTGGMSEREVARLVLEAMLESDPAGVWIIQSWQKNPSSELLAGIAEVEGGKDHALVLDLYAEKLPHHHEGGPGSTSYGYAKEFGQTPWLFCMLNNFGGRLGLHGHLDTLALRLPEVFDNCQRIAGIGITPEASGNNPVLYDYLFESVWQPDADGKMAVRMPKDWIEAYIRRRYGAVSEPVRQAWEIFLNTVYQSKWNQLGEGAPESVVNARPALRIQAASTWGNAVISYPKDRLEEAAKLFLCDYSRLKGSEGYRYDLVTVLQQVLSNRAQDVYQQMITAYEKAEKEGFETYAEAFLMIVDQMEELLGSSEYYLLGTWIAAAKALARNGDEFSKLLYEWNAKALITTWGSLKQSETGKLHDYSNRQWAGLMGDFYRSRWVHFIDGCRRKLNGAGEEDETDWFAMEWQWVRANTIYPVKPKEVDLEDLGKEIAGGGHTET